MKKLISIIITILLPLSSFAEIVQVKGTGTVSYQNTLTPEFKEKAYQTAQMKAIESFFAEQGDAAVENFDSLQDKIQTEIDKYITSTTILNEQDQTGIKKYSIVIRVELNASRLNNLIKKNSAIGRTAATNGVKSKLVYIFLGREVANTREYDARVYQRTDTNAKVDASVRGTRKNFSSKEKNSFESETGGSTLRKSDDVNFKLLPMQKYETSITSVFTQGGFDVLDPSMVIDDRDFKIAKDDIAKGNDLSPATKRGFAKKMQENQIQYLILTTLDVGLAAQDDATGLQRVGVNVTTRVLNSSLQEIASAPIKAIAAVAPNNTEARDLALKKSATEASKEVVSSLNASNVH